MFLLRSSGLEQCVVGGGPSLLQLLSRDAGGGDHHQLRALRQPASQVRAIDDRTDANMFAIEYIFNLTCDKITADKWNTETDDAFLCLQ